MYQNYSKISSKFSSQISTRFLQNFLLRFLQNFLKILPLFLEIHAQSVQNLRNFSINRKILSFQSLCSGTLQLCFLSFPPQKYVNRDRATDTVRHDSHIVYLFRSMKDNGDYPLNNNTSRSMIKINIHLHKRR